MRERAVPVEDDERAEDDERVEDDERTRVFRAMAAAVCDGGVRSVTLAEVAARAEISARRLRTHYADVDECFLAAFDWSSRRAGAAMARAYREESSWVDGVGAALVALLELIDREPELARLWIIHSLGAGPAVLRSRTAAIEVLCEYIDRGRLVPAARVEPPAITAEGVVGALLAVLQTRLLAGGSEPVAELVGELMSVILLPYMGTAAARRELSRPMRRPSQLHHSGHSIVGGVGMRLTHRTARVLTAIAERPGASNREVADLSEVVDQGQISKLLKRLESQGLIANAGSGAWRGAPNAWELTPRGEQLARDIRLSATESARSLSR